MKAVVYHGVGDIRFEDVPEPRLEEPTDAIVRITASAICGTDLHMVRGTMPGMKKGTILGHEGVGVVEDVGPTARNLQPGDRVVVPSTIACGTCNYCRAGYFAQCNRANPNGPDAGTAFFGGPLASGAFDGMQAELVRVPYANVGPVKLPEAIGDDDAILLSDILPTSWFGARLAEVQHGDVVAVFGAGIVGQLVVASALHMGASRVLVVDSNQSRLDHARWQGAEPINFELEDPVEALKRLTGGPGPDRVIDAVGIDAYQAYGGPVVADGSLDGELAAERAMVATDGVADDGWHPGDAPSQALRWAVASVAKAGTVAIIGVYPPALRSFPIGEAMNKNLTVNAGNCNHRRYLRDLVTLVAGGQMRLAPHLTQDEPMTDVVAAYRHFDRREPGWLKVKVTPEGAATAVGKAA